MNAYLKHVTLALVVIAFGPAVVHAQRPVFPLQELDAKLQLGDDIQLTDFGGGVFLGRFGGIFGTSLLMTGAGPAKEVPETSIQSVRVRRSDPVWNGAVFGLAMGAAAAIGGISLRDGSRHKALLGAAGAGAGAAAGVLVDRAFRKYNTIFELPLVSLHYRFSVVPFLLDGRRGLGLSISF